jgi:hypothetical protein
MSHSETEFVDVLVVLHEFADGEIDKIVEALTAACLRVSDVDMENGVIEGAIQIDKRKGLDALPFVKYVRNVFDFVAEEGDGVNDDGEPTDERVQR